MSRRENGRSRRAYGPKGGIGSTSGGGAVTPLTILEAIRAGSALQWQRPDFDQIVFNGSNVASLLDRSAAANHDSQATALAQPLWIASVAAANNRPGIQYDGANEYMDNAITRPAPATTSTLIWTVLRQDTWTDPKPLFSGISATTLPLLVQQRSASPALRQNCGTEANASSGAPVGQVKRLAAYFSGSVSDFLQTGSALVTGVSAGNDGGSTGYRKGANRVATLFSAWTVFDFVMASGLTPAEAATAVTNLDNDYAIPWFGAGIVT